MSLDLKISYHSNITLKNNIESQRSKKNESIYESDAWLSVVRDGFDITTGRLKITNNNKIIANLPLMMRRKIFFKLVGIPLRGTHSEFGGLILLDSDREEILLAIHKCLRKAGNSWIELIFPPEVNSDKLKDFLSQIGYEVEQKHSLVLDLNQSIDDVWKGFQGRARTDIRKAKKNGLQVKCLGPEYNHDYMNLVKNVFSNQKRKNSFDIRFLDALHKHLLADRLAHYGVFLKGKLIAGGIFLKSSERMVFVSGASIESGKKLGANSLIQWKAITDAHTNGILEYDLGGTGIARIDKFKHSFGGVPIITPRYVYQSALARFPAVLFKFAHSRGWLK
jgi:hypothetical protein